jgi:hypothetical protein
MSDFETRARAAADALDPEAAVGDPAAVRIRLRRRRITRVVASGAVVVVSTGVIALTFADRPLRIGTTASTVGPSAHPTTTTTDSATTSSSSTSTPVPDTVPNTIPLPAAPTAPAVLVATEHECVRRALGTADVVAAAADHVRSCFAMSDGSIVAERSGPDASTVATRFVSGADPVDLPLANPRVLGAGVIAGRAVLFVVLGAPPGTENQAPITVYDVGSGSQRTFGFGSGPDSGANRISTDGHFIVASENADQGVGVRSYNADGTAAAGLPDLSDQMQAYPSQDVVQLVISPDGTRLAYLDGPPFRSDGNSDPNGTWALVIVDVATGHELQRTVLSTGQDQYTWLDYDGRWAVASRIGCGDNACAGRAAVVVDTEAAHPSPMQIPGASGTTTLATAS